MNTNKKQNYLLLFFLIIFIHLNLTTSTPLSLCTKGLFSYTPDSSIKSQTCSLPEISSELKIYPASVNKAFFNSYEKCGICYEMAGPFGAVKLRVVDSNEDSTDSTPFFKLGSEASFTLMNLNDTNSLDQNKQVGISFRMISCDYSDKVKILTGEDNYQGFSFGCLVYNNNIPISSVRIKENGGSSFTEIKKSSDNFYFYDKGDMISYPVELRLISITGEMINTTITSKESDETYECSGNFYNPDKYYYNVEDLKRVKTTSTENCCSMDYTDYSNIYTNGVINDNYEATTENSDIDTSSDQITKVKLNNNGKLYVKSKMPIRADQFISISLSIQGNKVCADCLYISSYDKTIENKISIQSENTLKNYNYLFSALGVEDNTFNGFVIYTKENDIEIGISDIQITENSNAPSAEICVGGSSGWVPIVPINPDIPKQETTNSIPKESTIHTNNIHTTEVQTTKISNTYINTTDIPTTYISANGTGYIYLNVKNISWIDIQLILVECEPFTKEEGKTIKLYFKSTDGNNTKDFETINCFFDEDQISAFLNINRTKDLANSFACYTKNRYTIDNGKYKLDSSDDYVYKINKSDIITIRNGVITYGNNSNSKNEATPIINDKLIITNSINKIVNKGEIVNFNIKPIERNIFNIYKLNEIIFLEYSQYHNALYLKNCVGNSTTTNITIVDLISCTVSNNMIKGNYSFLANGQDIEIEEGQTINLICSNSYGGSFSEDKNEIINANISRRLKQNYTINFKVDFYDLYLKPNDTFPYPVYLYGKKISNNLRILPDLSSYDLNFKFPNCTMGSYKSVLTETVDGINCNLPDFVEAGEYSHIVSNGFDVNPNQKINIIFPYDFNKSENYIKSNSNGTINYRNKDESSSSKTWIVWLVLGILVAILIAIIIIAFCLNRNKSNNKDINDTSEVANNSGANQLDNSNNSQNNNQNVSATS